MKLSTKSLSIHKTTFISYISLTVIMVTLMALMAYTAVYPALSDLTEDNLVAEVNYVNQSVESTLNKTLYSCELLAQNNTLIEMAKKYSATDYIGQFYEEKNIRKFLTEYWSSHLSVASTYLVLPNNKISAQRTEFAYIESLETMADIEWFASMSDLSTAIVTKSSVDDYHSVYIKPAFITILNQLYDLNDNFVGYTVTNLSIGHFESNFYNSRHLIPDSYVYTVDNLGNILYANTDIPIDNFFDYKSTISTSSAKCVETDTYTAICSETSKHGWKTIQITPTAPLYKKISIVKYIATSMIFITLILGLLLSFILSRFTTVPVMKLADNMKFFVKSGKLKKLSNDYENEIGVIINTYNNMIDHIEQLMDEQKQHMHLRKQAELKMLQAQINPHFLYNTLDSISWRAIRSNVPEISKLLTKLARLYQHSLYKGLDVHPLGQELEQIELYMSLQQECFNSEFIYDIEVEDELLSLYIPRFILQPIIENTIIHGFGGTKAKGIISISAKAEDGKLVINISDNGKGIDFDIMNRINTNGYKSERYGIINIKERISLICGDEFGITFSNNEPFGTTVTYELPICTDYEFFERR